MIKTEVDDAVVLISLLFILDHRVVKWGMPAKV